MAKTTRLPEVAVRPIHFEDFSGPEFERLCLAYLLRVSDWTTIDLVRPAWWRRRPEHLGCAGERRDRVLPVRRGEAQGEEEAHRPALYPAADNRSA